MFKQSVGRKALPQSLLCTLLVCLTVLFLVGCQNNYTLSGTTTNGNGHKGSTTSGGSGSNNSGSGSNNSGSGSNNSGSGSNNSGSGSNNSGSADAPSLPISVKSIVVQGPLPESVLVDAQGRTLYIHLGDGAYGSVCTTYQACTGQWPPLLSNGSCTPTSTTNLPGVLSVVRDLNGVQVEYQGYPLFASLLDTAPGQVQQSATGAGPGTTWGVATADLPLNTDTNASGSAFATPTPGAWCGQ